MQQREEINHSFVVTVFARWRGGIPQALYNLAGQVAVCAIGGVCEGESTHGIGSCHATAVVAKGSAAVEGEMTMGEVVVFEKTQQSAHHFSLALFVLAR